MMSFDLYPSSSNAHYISESSNIEYQKYIKQRKNKNLTIIFNMMHVKTVTVTLIF